MPALGALTPPGRMAEDFMMGPTGGKRGSGRGAAAGLALLCSGAGAALADNVAYYVRTSGSNSNNGRTRETAFRTIQRAVDACTESNTNYTVYVGPGTYAERVLVDSDARDGTPSNPHQIIGDISGVFTGEAAGPVVIDGGNTRTYGLRFDGIEHWGASYLTFRRQTHSGVQLEDAPGCSVSDCVIRPATYGIYSYSSDVVFDRNTFERDLTTGSCIYARADGNGDITITRNRMTLTGSSYLAGGQGGLPGSLWSLLLGQAQSYGVYVLTDAGKQNDVRVDNNIVSDMRYGIYIISLAGNGSDIRVRNSTLVGCTYPVYILSLSTGSCVVRNTIVSDCYYSVNGLALNSSVRGLLTFNIATGSSYSSGLGQVSGAVTGDPMFRAPATGDFSVRAGSPALDAGVPDSGVTMDIAGNVRPLDGDRDGDPVIDLGAYESTPSSSLRLVGAVESMPTPARARLSGLGAGARGGAGQSVPVVDGAVTSVNVLLRQLFGGN